LLQLTLILRHDKKDLRIFIENEVASLEDDDSKTEVIGACTLPNGIHATKVYSIHLASFGSIVSPTTSNPTYV
jgi:hypothetical protein